MTIACESQRTRAHARAHAIRNMVAQDVWIINLIQITNCRVSVLLFCCLFTCSEMTSNTGGRLPLSSPVFNAWIDYSPMAETDADVVLRIRDEFKLFSDIYGSKILGPDNVPQIVLPALLMADIKGVPDWLDCYYTKIKHKLELSQSISIMMGDESLEDFGPRSTTTPIFNAGQQPLIEQLSRMQSEISAAFTNAKGSTQADLISIGRIISQRQQAEMRRGMIFFLQRRRALFEALASSISSCEWGVQLVRKLEEKEHVLEGIVTGVAPHNNRHQDKTELRGDTTFDAAARNTRTKTELQGDTMSDAAARTSAMSHFQRTPRALPAARRLSATVIMPAPTAQLEELQAGFQHLLQLMTTMQQSLSTPASGRDLPGSKDDDDFDESSGVKANVIVAVPKHDFASEKRQDYAFAAAVRATGLNILELRRDPHYLWLAIRERGAMHRFDIDALWHRLQRVSMEAGESLRDVADRIDQMAAQYSKYDGAIVTDRHKRLLLTAAVAHNTILREALDAHESLHDYAETNKNFDELVEFLVAVEAKHRRRAEAQQPVTTEAAVKEQGAWTAAESAKIPPLTAAAAVSDQQQQPQTQEQRSHSQANFVPNVCLNCGARGHQRSRCTEPSQGILRCFRCGDTTHRIASCPQPATPATNTFAASARAHAARSKARASAPAIVFEDEEYSTEADERVMHAYASHAAAYAARASAAHTN